jgi:AraC-like DNA-binding protein
MDPNATANAHFAPRQREPAFAGTATVSSEYLRLLVTGAELRDLDIRPIFAACGIDGTILERRGARVDARASAEVWKRSTARLGDPLFGLKLFENFPLGAVNLIDYLVMSSADVGDGLGRVARYAPLMGDAERLTLTVERDEARFRFQSRNEVPYPVEMVVGVFVRRARDLFGPCWSLKRVCFAHAALGSRAAYDRICQAPVHFEMPFTEVVFARDLLALPMAGADVRLNAMFVTEAERALSALAPVSGPSFIDGVKRVLEDGLHERDLTLARLADRLGVSTRTLQRRLRAAGVTHRGLVRGVRQDLATRSLATRVSQEQIARTLGYSGAGAFHRAFKRWSGVAPGQLRRNSDR